MRRLMLAPLVFMGCGGLMPDSNLGIRAQTCTSEEECQHVVSEAKAALEYCSSLFCEHYRTALERATERLANIRQTASDAARTKAFAEDLAAEEARSVKEQAERQIKAHAEETRLATERELAVRREVERDRVEVLAALKRRCDAERDSRPGREADRAQTIQNEATRQKARIAALKWIKTYCFVVREPIFDVRTYIDGNGFYRARRVVVDYDEYTRCPRTAPAAVVDAGDIQRDEDGILFVDRELLEANVKRLAGWVPPPLAPPDPDCANVNTATPPTD